MPTLFTIGYEQATQSAVVSALRDAGVEVLADIRSGGALDLARLSVAVRELRNLIQSSGAAQVAAEPATAPPAA